MVADNSNGSVVASSAAANETVGTGHGKSVGTVDNTAVDGLVAVGLEQSVLSRQEVQLVPLWVEVQPVEVQLVEVQPWPWEWVYW